MSFLQKALTAIMPRSWSRSMETNSRAWMVYCSCGFKRSVWEWGGIRWKASGTPPLPDLPAVRPEFLAHRDARTALTAAGITITAPASPWVRC